MNDISPGNELLPKTRLPEHFVLKVKDVLLAEPTRRNFSVIFTQEDQGLGVVLTKEDGSKKDLATYLPEGDRFAIDAEEAYDPMSHEVSVNPNRLQFKGSILTILHEIGHARTYTPHPRSELSGLQKAILTLEGLPRYFKVARKLQQSNDNLIGLSMEMILPKRYSGKILDYTVKSERNAWAEALTMAKELEGEGFNVLGEFESLEEIQEYVAFALTTYEYSMRRGQSLVGDSVTPGKFTKRAP